MLARWLDRDGIGQVLAPDEAAAKETIPDEKNSWFWQFVAPDPKFQHARVPPDQAFEMMKRSGGALDIVCICEHCGKETGISNCRRKGAVVVPRTPPPPSNQERALLQPQSNAQPQPPSTPAMLKTPSRAAATPLSNNTPYRPYQSDSALEQLVLSAAKETARSMHSPPNQGEQRNKLFRICATVTKQVNEKNLQRLAKMLKKDPTLFSARATHLGMLAPDGFTCLMAAAHAGHLGAAKVICEVASELVAAGNRDDDDDSPSNNKDYNIHADRDLQGRTALHIAAEAGHVEVVQFLQAQKNLAKAVAAAASSSPSSSSAKSTRPSQQQAADVDLLGRTPFGRVMTSPNPKARKKQKELEQMLFSPADVSIRGKPNPLEDRIGVCGSSTSIFYGIADMPGMRVTMEDAICTTTWQDPKRHDEYTLLGVCDGHGDHGQVSQYVANEIPTTLQKFMIEEEEPTNWQSIWYQTCMDVDMKLRTEGIKGGSTAVFALITPKEIIVANVGDSRCILVQSSANGLETELQKLSLENAAAGSPGYPESIDDDIDDNDANKTTAQEAKRIITPLSFDHKPNNEKERIENAGYQVQQIDFTDENGNELVFHKIVTSSSGAAATGTNQLAVSRAFGDFEYKCNAKLSQEEQAVIAVPDVIVHERSKAMDEYLILACDGIWDVMSNGEVGAFVSNEVGAKLGMGPTVLPDIGDELLSTCLDKGSRDNMSVVLVALDQISEQLGSVMTPSNSNDPVKALNFS